jgi:hypothetical protein
MKLRSLVLALAFAAATSVAARAQGALYVDPVAVRASISKADPSLYSFLGPGTTSRMFYGVDFGGFYDIPMQQKKFEVGVDLRDTVLHGNNALLNSFVLGPRIAFSPFTHPFHPYVEPFVGIGETRAPNTAIKVSKVQYGVFGGIDDEFSRRVTWRVVEVGYSSLTTVSGGTVGASESIPAAKLLSITSGLTFRLP